MPPNMRIPTTPFPIQFYIYVFPTQPPGKICRCPYSQPHPGARPGIESRPQFLWYAPTVGMGGTRIDERPLRIEASRGEEDVRSERRKHRRRLCCGITVAIVAIIAIVLVVLGLTVFKKKDPRITVESVTLDNVDFALATSGTPLRLNVTMSADVAVKNPNKASFKFRNSTTAVDYRGTTVAQAYLPPGKIPADKTVHLRPLVTILADRFAPNSQLVSDLMNSLPLSMTIRLVGRVNVLSIFKHHAVAYSSCDISVSLTQRKIQSLICSQKVKL